MDAPADRSLAQELRERITLEGPLPLDRYMALCLGHPVHGYYMKRDPFGRGGDFTTSPEISQMFGEMIGVWAASVWEQMGRPARFTLMELGPGRGTLMADMLRASRAMAGFREAADVVLLETSPALRQVQERSLAACGVRMRWLTDITDLGTDCPLLVIANEFFDALPIRQLVFTQAAGWRERMVGLDADGALCFGLSAEPSPDVRLTGQEGELRELCPDGIDIMARLSQRIATQRGALLAIDYGYARSAAGDSLQALKAHAFVDPLAEPGDADLTAHVDFEALAAAAKAGGALSMPLLTQKTLLERLGIGARAQALSKGAPARAGEINAALSRLTGTDHGAMGTLFKALAVAAPGLDPLVAFDAPDPVLQQLLT